MRFTAVLSFRTIYLRKMSQKTISSFFSNSGSKSNKRNLSEIQNFDSSNLLPEEKKVKNDIANCNTKNMCTEDPLKTCDNSDDAAQRIEANKLSAKLKLKSKLLPALHPNIGLTWYQSLESEFDKPYFKKLSAFLKEERSKTTLVFPPPNQVWTWTRQCRTDEVKVVILGQDPYHHPGQAHGLSFSVPVGVPPPPSLLNMYKELENDINGFKRPGHGSLIGWARQGVLLLNAVLTVKCRTPNSHKDQGWEKLTDAVIQRLSSSSEGIVFLLWGSYAQKKAELVDQNKHHLLKAVHPSPLSASRGFFGCKHFSKCNELLEKQGKKPIDWTYLPTD